MSTLRVVRLGPRAAPVPGDELVSEYTRFALRTGEARVRCVAERAPSRRELARLALHHRVWTEEAHWPYLVWEGPGDPPTDVAWAPKRPPNGAVLYLLRDPAGPRLAPPGTLAYVVPSARTRDVLVTAAVPFQVPVDALLVMLADLGDLTVLCPGGPLGRAPPPPRLSVRDAVLLLVASIVVVFGAWVGIKRKRCGSGPTHPRSTTTGCGAVTRS